MDRTRGGGRTATGLVATILLLAAACGDDGGDGPATAGGPESTSQVVADLAAALETAVGDANDCAAAATVEVLGVEIVEDADLEASSLTAAGIELSDEQRTELTRALQACAETDQVMATVEDVVREQGIPDDIVACAIGGVEIDRLAPLFADTVIDGAPSAESLTDLTGALTGGSVDCQIEGWPHTGLTIVDGVANFEAALVDVFTYQPFRGYRSLEQAEAECLAPAMVEILGTTQLRAAAVDPPHLDAYRRGLGTPEVYGLDIAPAQARRLAQVDLACIDHTQRSANSLAQTQGLPEGVALALVQCMEDRLPPDHELDLTTAQYQLGSQAFAGDDGEVLVEQLNEAVQACGTEILGDG